MTRRLPWCCFALLVTIAGCRTPHLGPGFGRANRKALDAQYTNRAGTAPAADGSDVEGIMQRHRSFGMPNTQSGSGSGMQQPMTLEGK